MRLKPVQLNTANHTSFSFHDLFKCHFFLTCIHAHTYITKHQIQQYVQVTRTQKHTHTHNCELYMTHTTEICLWNSLGSAEGATVH